jgi:hypothetical protein
MVSAVPSVALRVAVALDGRPVQEIARASGVSRSLVTRFLRGERGLSLKSVDRLSRVVRMELRPAVAAP